MRLAVGAGVLAVAAVGVAVLVPRRRWSRAAEPFRSVLASPLIVGLTAWAAQLWNETMTPGPPIFDDMRPFDEF